MKFNLFFSHYLLIGWYCKGYKGEKPEIEEYVLKLFIYEIIWVISRAFESRYKYEGYPDFLEVYCKIKI